MNILLDAAKWLDVWTNVLEPALGVTSNVMRHNGEVIQEFPKFIRLSLRRVVLASFNLFNFRPILNPVEDLVGRLATLSVDVSDRRGDHEALKLFFKLGRWAEDDPHFGNRLGSGIEDDAENVFFPRALAAGPNVTGPNVTQGTDQGSAMTHERNVKIAKTCAFLSMLSYRDDNDILRCMTNADPPMLPGVSLFSVHTHQEGDLYLFVADDQSWAVCCFRGTEFETLRDWFTSVMLNPLRFFPSCQSNNEGTRMKSMRVRDRYYKQMTMSCRDNTLQSVTMQGNGPIPPDADVSAIELINYLQKREGGCRVYYTGHSLGAGLATLFGAYMKAWGRSPSAIVTFGSPPVGDETFCQWFNANIKYSWRFVNGDEFAPMAPPLPFTEPVETQELVHVKGLIKVEDIRNPNPHAMTPQEMDDRLKWLEEHDLLSKIVLDHNPALTLAAL